MKALCNLTISMYYDSELDIFNYILISENGQFLANSPDFDEIYMKLIEAQEDMMIRAEKNQF